MHGKFHVRRQRDSRDHGAGIVGEEIGPSAGGSDRALFCRPFSLAPASAEPIFKRGRPPIYPYYYSPGRPGGTDFYFGFVPYVKGDYETQALQRQFPEMNYPPSMRYWNPNRGSPIR